MDDFADDAVLFARATKRLRALGHPDLATRMSAVTDSVSKNAGPQESRMPGACRECGANILTVTVSEDHGGGSVTVDPKVRTVVQIAGRKVGRAWNAHECRRG